MNRNEVTVTYGPTVVVLAEWFESSLAPYLPPEQRAAWRERTDFAAACSVCPRWADVPHVTVEGARRAANGHAHEHGGARVEAVES